jgi:hypothetical protein
VIIDKGHDEDGIAGDLVQLGKDELGLKTLVRFRKCCPLFLECS